MKKKNIALAIWAATTTAIVALGITRIGQTDTKNYPATLIVTRVDEKSGTVSAATVTGIEYHFPGTEDWEIGDLCSAFMNENGTPETVLDDVVISCRYAGDTESLEWVAIEAVEHYHN